MVLLACLIQTALVRGKTALARGQGGYMRAEDDDNADYIAVLHNEYPLIHFYCFASISPLIFSSSSASVSGPLALKALEIAPVFIARFKQSSPKHT